jgi:hypothetical protein
MMPTVRTWVLGLALTRAPLDACSSDGGEDSAPATMTSTSTTALDQLGPSVTGTVVSS